MNRFLSLLICISIAHPTLAMRDDQEAFFGKPQPIISTPRRLANKVWETCTSKKTWCAVGGLIALSILSSAGYFLTNTCLTMKDACHNCTNDFQQANHGLELIGVSATILKELMHECPLLAIKYIAELNKALNQTHFCS